jgi:hypothetical protein
MPTVKKSITRLLAERKNLEDRIRKASNEKFVGIQKGTDPSTADVVGMSGKTVAQASDLFKTNKDRVSGLIKYHRRITEALVKANAITEVKIGGETMTIAAAIERKKSISYDKALLATIITQANAIQREIDNANAELDRRIDAQVTSAAGSDKAKITPELRKNIADPLMLNAKQSPIDPNNIGQWATEELDRISKFETEVDFVLSEVNARTEIELEDETSISV